MTGPAGITEAEQLGHFVVSLAGGVVARFAEQAVLESLAHFEQVRVSAADHQRQRRVKLDLRPGSRTTA